MPRKATKKPIKTAPKRKYTRRPKTVSQPVAATQPIVVNTDTRTFIEKNFLYILIVGIFLFLMFKPSGCGSNTPAKPDTTRTTNTVYVPQPPVYIPTYIPVPTSSKEPASIPTNYMPAGTYDSLLKQYQLLANSHFTENRYADSTTLHDSSGKRVGVFNLDETVSQNKIQGRSKSYALNFPVTTNTITITKPYEPKNMGFVGLGLSGNATQYVDGAYGEFLLKNKKDHIYGIQAGVQSVNGTLRPQFGLKTDWKISFGK